MMGGMKGSPLFDKLNGPEREKEKKENRRKARIEGEARSVVF